MQTNPSAEAHISAGAERMRVSRQRRRDGLRLVPLEIRETEIDRLIALGLLRPEDRDDRNEVAFAMYRFLEGSRLSDGHR